MKRSLLITINTLAKSTLFAFNYSLQMVWDNLDSRYRPELCQSVSYKQNTHSR
jgi:hypothetical protein